MSDQPNLEPAVVVSRREWDELRVYFMTLLDFHGIVRTVEPLVMGRDLTDEEIAHIRMDFQHFWREYMADPRRVLPPTS